MTSAYYMVTLVSFLVNEHHLTVTNCYLQCAFDTLKII